MNEASHDFNAAGIAVEVLGVAIAAHDGNIILRISGSRVDAGALREVVAVADSHVPTRHFEAAFLVCRVKSIVAAVVVGIHVTNDRSERAAEDRVGSTEGDAIAFHVGAIAILGISDFVGLRAIAPSNAILLKAAERIEVANFTGIIEVLRRTVNLHEAEVVRGSKSSRQGVVELLVVRVVVVVADIDRIDDDRSVEVAVGRRHGSAVVAVSRGLAFVAILLGIILEGILGIHLDAGEFRRSIGDHVVEAVIAIGHDSALNNRVAPAGGERRELAEEAIRAVVTERFP